MSATMLVVGVGYRTAWALLTVLATRRYGLASFALLGFGSYAAMACATWLATGAGRRLAPRTLLTAAAVGTAVPRAAGFVLLLSGLPLWAVVTAEMAARLASPVLDGAVRTVAVDGPGRSDVTLTSTQAWMNVGLWGGSALAGAAAAFLPTGGILAVGLSAAVLPAVAAVGVGRRACRHRPEVNVSRRSPLPVRLVAAAAVVFLFAGGLPSAAVALVEDSHGSVWLLVVAAGELMSLGVAPAVGRRRPASRPAVAVLLAGAASAAVWAAAGSGVAGLTAGVAASAVASTWILGQLYAAAVDGVAVHDRPGRLLQVRLARTVGVMVAAPATAGLVAAGLPVRLVGVAGAVGCLAAAGLLHRRG